MILGIACLLPALTIAFVWSLGRAQGLLLPVPDAAVLFTVMIGVALVPISISGWGLRELAVISLLGHHGIAPERALLFSADIRPQAFKRLPPWPASNIALDAPQTVRPEQRRGAREGRPRDCCPDSVLSALGAA
jgi:hypothetical protein